MMMNTFGPGDSQDGRALPRTTEEKPHYILIVDDDPFILDAAGNTLSLAGYRCRTARTANYALRELQNPNQTIDLMVADVLMSGMNGIDLMKYALALQPDLPVIMISAASELDTAVQAQRAGSADYLIKPFDHQDLVKCITIALARRRVISEQTRAARWRAAADAFSLSLDARDKETEGHAQRVVAYSVRLGWELGLSRSQLVPLELGARLHDIGKIAVPDNVLKKPATLTVREKQKMRLHPATGRSMVLALGLPDEAARIVGEHHEQWDGSGYPLGLKGEEISLGARVFAVADAFDAITSDRCYRRGRPYQDALEELLKYSGTQFDPQVVEAFARIDPIEWELLRNAPQVETSFSELSRIAS